MNTEPAPNSSTPPPLGPIPPEAETPAQRSRVVVGRIGLICSCIALTMLCVMFLLRPGWGSPVATLGGLTLVLGVPVGFLLSLVGLFVDRPRTAAWIGLAISLGILLFAFGPLCV